MGLISFRIEWFDLLAVQGTLKSLLQHHLKTTILQHSAFFMVQLSHLYVTTGKTITWTIQIGQQRVVSAFYYVVSIGDSFSSKEQASFNSWLQSPFAVILEPPKIKSDTVSTVSPSMP